MRFISLFSGIGGFDLGFERAGMNCVAQVEFNKAAAKNLKYHWANVAHYEDVRNVGKHNLPAADLICGGFPCQDVSVAGKRAGLAGERSGLWFEFLRIITECTPGWVVIENVPGLLNSNRGADFATVIYGLVNCGYRVCWRVLDAQYFGLAQRRKRVFIVASLRSALANPAQVLFERESRQWDTPPSRQTRQGTAPAVIKGAAIGRRPENGPQRGEIIQDDTCYTLNTSEVHAVAGALPASGAGTSRTGNERTEASFLVPTVYGINSELNANEEFIGSLTLPSISGGGHPAMVARAIDVRNLRSNGDISGTLQTKKSGGYSLNYQNPIAFHWQNSDQQSMAINEYAPTLQTDKTPAVLPALTLGVRRLTPIECERLQGFPDNWTLVDGASDSTRYKQLGNAIAVPVAEWLGKRIMAAIPKAIVLYVPKAA